MAFSLIASLAIVILQVRYIKRRIEETTLFWLYGLILFILIIVGFLYHIEIIILFPMIFIFSRIIKLFKLSSKSLSYLVCVSLLLLVTYCQFFNGVFFTDYEEFSEIHRRASAYHGYFPIKLVPDGDKYTIYSLELGFKLWGGKSFQDTIWLKGTDVIHYQSNCGFGEMCNQSFEYGSNTPYAP